MTHPVKTTVSVSRPGGGPAGASSSNASLPTFYHARPTFDESLLSATRPQQLARSSRHRRLMTIHARASDEPMTVGEQQTAEGVLASLVGRAFAAEHPDLFGPYLVRAIGGTADAKR